jgi:NAD-dependent dihydropyrimidine dehydrogenase PreA subunit
MSSRAEGPQILDGCIGCVICVDMCPGDVLRMDTVRKVAVVEYADECWYCGVCRLECPVDVVRFVFPVMMIRV